MRWPAPHLSQVKRRYIRRLAGYVTNPVQRRIRIWRNREQTLDVKGLELHLPPEHDLPFFQRRDPTYDTYAIELVRNLVAGADRPAVIDVGANVGDTAVAMLAADPRLTVLSVEGSPRFAPYLERNLMPHADRASWRIGFVGPVGTRTRYQTSGSTGGFQLGTPEVTHQDSQQITEWITPRELIAAMADSDLLIYKSDIDGFDIHVLADHWDDIDARCAAIWFEYDPARTLGDPGDVGRLLEQLAQSRRTLWVYDNLGRRMFTCPASQAPEVLGGLAEWLSEGFRTHLSVPYLDVWAVRTDEEGPRNRSSETLDRSRTSWS